MFDKIVIAIALVGGLIRLGNLMNSEIYGGPTDLLGIRVFFATERRPAHPTQIYEAQSTLLFLPRSSDVDVLEKERRRAFRGSLPVCSSS